MLGHNLESLSYYPYISGVKGINFGKIDIEIQPIRSESGRELMVEVGYGMVRVTDMSGWSDCTIMMVATARENQVAFGLYTRAYDHLTGTLGDRHPDFDIWSFAQAALGYFADNRLLPIQTMMSNYNSNSFTARQYWDLRSQGKTKPEAARLTWEGKLAKLLKFDYVALPISEDGKNVRVLWSKTGPDAVDES